MKEMNVKLKVKVFGGISVSELGSKLQEFCDKLEDKEEFSIWHVSNIIDKSDPLRGDYYNLLILYDG